MKKTAMTVATCLIGLAPVLGHAASVSPVFVDMGLETTTAEGTRMYRADLTGLGLTEVAAVTIKDSNSGLGGSPGIYSGFDLDAVFLDQDGSLATIADRIFVSALMFSAGTLRPGGVLPPSSSGGTTNGSTATGVDEPFATLNDVDAIWFGTGSLTLGDGGSLVAAFASAVEIGSSMFLFVGEVSGDPGEIVDASIEIADVVPAVPLPATGLLLAGALGLMGLRRRRG